MEKLDGIPRALLVSIPYGEPVPSLIESLRAKPESIPERIKEIAELPLAEFALLEGELKDLWRCSGGQIRTLNALLKDARIKLQAAAKAAKAAQKRQAAALTGVPEFEIGDSSEIAEKLHVILDTVPEPLAFGYERLYRYSPDSRCWKEHPDHRVSVMLQSWSGAAVFRPGKDDTGILRIDSVATPITLLKHRVAATTPEDFFENAPPGIVFEDVAIIVRDGEMVSEPVGPSLRAMSALPYKYNPDHPAPTFKAYLDSVFGDAPDAAARVGLLQEFIGAALCRLACRYDRACVIFGPPGTGKSTILKIVEALFPRDRRCSVTPQQMGDDYHGATLLGAWLNLVFELPEDDVLGESGFKSVVVGETIQRREAYGKPFRFSPVAAHLFAANELPTAPAATKAFWDRWLVIPFDCRFRGTSDQKRDLADIVIAEEMPGVAAWAVEGALRLLSQNGYSIPESAAAAIDEWKEEANPIVAWARERTRPGGFTSTRDLHDEWKKWAKDAGHHGLARTTFGRRMAQVYESARASDSTRGYCCEILKPWQSEDEIPF